VVNSNGISIGKTDDHHTSTRTLRSIDMSGDVMASGFAVLTATIL
jgi:hypothetical protein